MAQFKRSIQSGGFRPEQVSTDNERRLQEHANRVIDSLRAQQNAVLSNRNLIADSMEKNAKIESQQAAFNQSIQEQNINTQLKEQQELSRRALQQYETRTKETETLFTNISNFSLTASKKLREIEVERFEKKDKALAGEIMALGDNHPDVKALKSLKLATQIEEVDAKTQLNIARERGADPLEVDEALKRLNGLGYHAKSALLQHISSKWSGYLSQRFLSDAKDFTDPVTGQTFAGSEAARDPQRNLIVSAQALKDFEALYGISGQLAALKQETGYYNNIFKVSESYAAVARNAKLEDNSQEILADFNFKSQQFKDKPTEAQTYYETEFPGLRARFGNKQALDTITELGKQLDAEGKPIHNLAALAAARIGPKGEKFGDHWPERIAEIKKARVNGYNAIINAQEGNLEAKATDYYRNSLEIALKEQLAKAGPQEDLSIFATARTQLQDKFGYVPRAFTELERSVRDENTALSKAKADLVLEKIRTGTATQGDILSIADPTLRAQVQTEYVRTTKVRKYGENYDVTLKAVKNAAKQIMGDSLEGAASFEAERLNLVMQKNFAADYEKGLTLFGGDTTRALQYASDILEKDKTEALANNNPKARYYSETGPNNQKVFKNVRGLESKTNAQKQAALNTLRDTIGAVGVNALDSPGVLGSEMELRRISEANRVGGTLIFTPQIKLASQLLRISPIEATNTAIAAHNRTSPVPITPLTLDPINRAINNARPETLKLFTDNPTPGRVQRGAAEIAGASVLTDSKYMRSTFRTTTQVTGKGFTIKGLNDSYGRPVVMDQPAVSAFAQMMQDSGGVVKSSDITSSQRSHDHNRKVGGVPGSAHLSGNAIDIHGSSRQWMIKNGPKYGWFLIDYSGSHGGHFEYRPN